MEPKKWHKKLTPEAKRAISSGLKALYDREKQIDTDVREISPELTRYVKKTRIEAKEYFLNRYFPDWVERNCPDGWPSEENIISAIRDYQDKREAVLTDPTVKKPYKCKKRAYGIALAFAYYNNRITETDWNSEAKRAEIARDKLCVGDGGTGAAKEAAKIFKPEFDKNEKNLTEYQEDFRKDYDYGLILYKKYWP